MIRWLRVDPARKKKMIGPCAAATSVITSNVFLIPQSGDVLHPSHPAVRTSRRQAAPRADGYIPATEVRCDNVSELVARRNRVPPGQRGELSHERLLLSRMLGVCTERQLHSFR